MFTCFKTSRRGILPSHPTPNMVSQRPLGKERSAQWSLVYGDYRIGNPVRKRGIFTFTFFPSETKVYAPFKKPHHYTRFINLSRSLRSLFVLYWSCLYAFNMAKLVAVCRDEADFAFERRQIPLNIEDTLTVWYTVFYFLRKRIRFR